MRKIILHGHLHDLYPEPIEVVADTVAEAMRSLQQIEAFSGEGPHPVRIEGIESEADLFSETDMEEIHVHPWTEGSSNNTFVQILIGATLIAVGVFTGGVLGLTAGQLILSGALMVTGGLLALLAPTPAIETGEQGPSSKYLGAQTNTVQIGTRIPLVYGFRRLFGHYISYDVDAKDWDGTEYDDPQGDKATYGVVTQYNYDRTVTVDGLGVVDPRFASSVAAATGNDPVSGLVA